MSLRQSSGFGNAPGQLQRLIVGCFHHGNIWKIGSRINYYSEYKIYLFLTIYLYFICIYIIYIVLSKWEFFHEKVGLLPLTV